MKFPSFCDKFNMPHGSLKTKARFFATVQNDTSGVIAFSFQVLLKSLLIKPCTPRHCPCYEQLRAERVLAHSWRENLLDSAQEPIDKALHAKTLPLRRAAPRRAGACAQPASLPSNSAEKPHEAILDNKFLAPRRAVSRGNIRGRQSRRWWRG